jgi:cytochrome c2
MIGWGGVTAAALFVAACAPAAGPPPTPTPQRPPAAGQPLAPTPAPAKPQPGAAEKPGEKPSAGGPGDPARGKQLFVQKGCTACHVAPGVPEATGTIGPSLAGIASKPKILSSTGELDNTPDNMVRWIMNPPAVKPTTQMPPLGVTEAEARDIAAFLQTLR